MQIFQVPDKSNPFGGPEGTKMTSSYSAGIYVIRYATAFGFVVGQRFGTSERLLTCIAFKTERQLGFSYKYNDCEDKKVVIFNKLTLNYPTTMS